MSILKETKDLLCKIFDLDPSDVDYIEVHFTKDWGGDHGRDAGGWFDEKDFQCQGPRTIRSATHMETE
jgi:hypothetical protein